MSKIKVPFSPLPPDAMLALSRKIRGTGSMFGKAIPNLGESLRHAEIQATAEEYGGIMAVMFIMYFALGALVAFIFATKLAPAMAIPAALLAGLVAALLVVVQAAVYPTILIKKKVRDLERNLVFALRTILVEIKSGVTLFDAINIVAEGDNGQVSKEFKKSVESMQTGSFQITALEELAERNPSLHFRRAIWQLVNGLKAGSDVSMIMTALVNTLTKEKGNQVRKYGNSLKLLSLLYMMLGAIIPALGLTFLIILSTFPQIAITEWVFWGMLGFIIVGQFMYLGIIKSSRPPLLGD